MKHNFLSHGADKMSFWAKAPGKEFLVAKKKTFKRLLPVLTVLGTIAFCVGTLVSCVGQQAKLQEGAEQAYPIGSVIELDTQSPHRAWLRVESVLANVGIIPDDGLFTITGTLIVHVPEGLSYSGTTTGFLVINWTDANGGRGNWFLRNLTPLNPTMDGSYTIVVTNIEAQQ